MSISKVNFGPLVEQSPVDNTKEKENYNKIDDLFLNYLQKLFNTRLSKEKIMEFAVGHKFEG